MGTLARPLGSIVIGVSAALTVIGIGVLVFLNPIWVGFEQARTEVDRLTGYTMDDVHRITNEIVGEVVFGPATFLQQVGGQTVFDPKERQHLVDVHGVMVAFLVLVVVAVVALIVAAIRVRDREWLWRSIGIGTAVLAALVVGLGVVFALFFDLAFDLFHRLFFASGSYTFDPGEERLVQLFPENFWSETSIALAVVILIIAGATAGFALNRAEGLRSAARAARQPAVPVGAP